jgi:predicted phage terminase large subunit-like protein
MRGDDGWRCLTLPALAGPADPLGRQLGEALWPEWQSEAAIARRRLEVGERTFAALYQQSPRAPDSALFNTKTIEILAEAPAMDRTIRAWDLAATIPGTGRDPDYTVGLKLGVNQRFEMVVLDIVRFRGSPSEVEARILATAKADGPATMIALPQDPGQAGVAQIAMLKPKLEAFRVEASAETGSKVMRAMPTATQIDKANLSLVAAPWNDSFLSELSVFPDSPKDDQVDALSRAVNTLLTTSMGSARRLSIPLMGR